MKIWLILFFSVLSLHGQATELKRYAVFFKDKAHSNYSLSKPEQFLSTRSLERRLHHNVVLTEEDLPVSTTYLNMIKYVGVRILYTSKWVNAAVIETYATNAKLLYAFSFVDRVEYVAPEYGLGQGGRKSQVDSEKVGKTEQRNADQNNMLGISVLHNEEYKGNGRLIAVLDAGFYGVENAAHFSHLYNNNNLLATKNFVKPSSGVYGMHTHGSVVLSTLAANVEGEYTGTAPGAQYAIAITEDPYSEFRIEEYNYLAGAEWADSLGADIISASLGYKKFDDPEMDYTTDELNGKHTVVSFAARMASTRGMLVVNSAGNNGRQGKETLLSPADVEEVLSVGAVTSESGYAQFSSQGPTADGRTKPDVSAMGAKTVVVLPSGYYAHVSGTSLSAPLITGLAACLWQKYPDATASQIKQWIIAGGNNAVPDYMTGYGVPHVERIEAKIDAKYAPKQAEISIHPNPLSSGQKLYISLDADEDLPVITDLNGRHVRVNMEIKSDGTLILDTSGMRSGVYLVSLSRNTRSQNLRLLVQ